MWKLHYKRDAIYGLGEIQSAARFDIAQNVWKIIWAIEVK